MQKWIYQKFNNKQLRGKNNRHRAKLVLFLFGILMLFYYLLNSILHQNPSECKLPETSLTNDIEDFVNQRFNELYNMSSVRNVSTRDFDFSKILGTADNINSPTLWGRGSRKLLTKPWVHEKDRILEQLILLREEFDRSNIGNFTKKKILVSRLMHWWITDYNQSNNRLLNACPKFEDKCEFILNPKILSKNSSSDISAVILDGFSRRPVQRVAYPDDVLIFFYTLESNLVSNIRLRKQNDILASYWSCSDIVTPYGKWMYFDPDVRQRIPDQNFAAGKTKLVAAFVSNCNPLNTRNEYLSLLEKHIQVDIFGKCGNLKCPKNPQDACFQKLKSEYKFYLAFENANCREYITEKFWKNALRNDVVPIVMGAHPDDYKAVCPENSYIHVEDFENPKALSEYLTYLDANDEEYNKYFAWKRTGKVAPDLFLCRVCAMVHYAELVPPPPRTEVINWKETSRNHLCLPRGQTYWTRTEKISQLG